MQFQFLKIGLGIIGVVFLFYYGFIKLKEAKNGVSISQSTGMVTSAKQAVFVSMAFSLLNPHVYLDTIVLIGGYASKFEVLVDRLLFGIGASTFSTIWFFSLAILASVSSRLLNSSSSMRRISFFAGLILIALATKLGLEVVGWINM